MTKQVLGQAYENDDIPLFVVAALLHQIQGKIACHLDFKLVSLACPIVPCLAFRMPVITGGKLRVCCWKIEDEQEEDVFVDPPDMWG